jgi:hypothetical protein
MTWSVITNWDVVQHALEIKSMALIIKLTFNPLMPNGHYSGHTAPLTSRRWILKIDSTITILNFINLLHNIRLPIFKMPFIS